MSVEFERRARQRMARRGDGMSRALIVVDVQNDFCEGGSLPVTGGAEVATKITDFIRAHQHYYTVVVASKDYHLSDSDNGGHFANTPDFMHTWPAHCVAGTPGSEFHPNLDVSLIDEIVYKGKNAPAYSAFEGQTIEAERLDDLLLSHGVQQVDVVGIATDYCVRSTVIDAEAHDYRPALILDLTAAVGGYDAEVRVTEEMVNQRIPVLNSDKIVWRSADATT